VGLIATDILTKGFDVPDVMIGVSARPFSKSLSSHIQQMGRVMRGCSGKDFALWLDHSGNYLRFREDWEEVYENGVHELDDGKEKTKVEPTEKEKTEAKCPKCEAYFPAYMDMCSNCGHVREKRNAVESVPGEMEELATSMTREDKQLWWSMLQYFVQYNGWKVGRAANVYKEKFGVWPRGLQDTVVIPNAEIKKFVDDGIKRYIRAIKRAR
jgi:superfamily II DNA/RNA helicase